MFAKIRLVEPSGFVSKPMGRTPWIISSGPSDHAISSVLVSITESVRAPTMPAAMYLPSGVADVLWTPSTVGIDFTILSVSMSMTWTMGILAGRSRDS